jgi:hypothetical protein
MLEVVDAEANPDASPDANPDVDTEPIIEYLSGDEGVIQAVMVCMVNAGSDRDHRSLSDHRRKWMSIRHQQI